MYNRQLHNKTYYEKNKENIKRKQREKRQKNEGGSTTVGSRESRDRK